MFQVPDVRTDLATLTLAVLTTQMLSIKKKEKKDECTK